MSDDEELKVEAQRAKLKAKREMMRAETKRVGDECVYLTGQHPYYSRGTLYPPGSVVSIPEDRLPSLTWTPIKPTVSDSKISSAMALTRGTVETAAQMVGIEPDSPDIAERKRGPGRPPKNKERINDKEI